MAQKKFLDLDGLKTYNGKIKAYADNAASTAAGNVDTGIRRDYKVKDVDTKAGAVALTLDSSTGKVGVTVSSNVVVDAEYSTVKANATNSAAAWNTFLGNPSSITTPSPKLSELATKTEAQSYATTAKSGAITKAGELDAALKSTIEADYAAADTTLKTTLIGAKGNASDADTIYGAKKYADEKAGAALTAANNAKAAADVAQSTANTAKANAATAQTAAETADAKAVAAQNTANELKNTTIPGLKSSLEGKITDNTDLINSTKDALIGGSTDTKDSNSIKGAKLYAKDLTDNITTRINSIVAGGVAFKGVVTEMPSNPSNGDLIIMGADVTSGSVTYKKDYEYIYSEGAWYELGDSDKNAKAIAGVKATADANATAIQRVEREYKSADTAIKGSITTLSNAAVKKITGGNSSYVTVTAGTKDNNGNVTLTVTDSIAATFDTQSSVNTKISNAKSDLIGNDKNGSDANTIYGAKAHATSLVTALENSLVAITTDEINKLFA